MPWKDHTVLERRIDFISLAQTASIPMSELCRRFGISRKTGYKWLARATEPANASNSSPSPPSPYALNERLSDRSRSPLHSPAQTGQALQAAVLALRHAHPAWGGRKIAHVLLRDQALQIAPSTVTHVLRRHGLISPAASTAATPWQRFEHEQPNSLWQMDFKGHFATHTGRCHALTVLDDHSRFNLVLSAHPNEQRSGVQQSLHGAFCTYGLPLRINTDNGSPWGNGGQGGMTMLGVWLVRLGVWLSYSAPAHPQTNGKEERFHRSLKAEVLQQPFKDLVHVQRAFDAWRVVYNRERPHQALGMATPAQRYRPSVRSLPATLPEVEYDSEDLVRKVQHGGWISVLGRELRISRALVGQPVAFRPRPDEDGVYDLFFCHQWLDAFDLRSSAKD